MNEGILSDNRIHNFLVMDNRFNPGLVIVTKLH